FWINFKSRQINGRHFVLPGEHFCEIVLLNEAELHQVVADACAVLALLVQGSGKLLPRDDPLANEEISNALARSDRCGHNGIGSRGFMCWGASSDELPFYELKRPVAQHLEDAECRRTSPPARAFRRALARSR